ncbi:MAG: HD domain-containing protein [Peptococcaceae bacterium]|nr:HD domain-containing protein [Peptococcaceae bacterium]
MNYNASFFRALVAEKLPYERFKHTIGVEVWARELARRFGLDQEAACLAALTHDMAKQFSLEDQVVKAKEWNLIYYSEDLDNPQVIHGRLAAYQLENEYQIKNRDILNAVANHTLGRPNMSPLEMLIYSADLTEPGRDFPGVDKLRRKLYYDLNKGTLACLEHTVQYLKKSNQGIHPLTLLTYNDLKNRLSE